jgi:DNA modification methylase
MTVRILHGDCREVLATLEVASVQCCVTSPPYYGLRDYGTLGQIGLEASPEAFVAEMVAVFRDVRRVLRDDGTLWLNLGDSYAATTKGTGGVGSSGLMRDGRPESGRGSADAANGRAHFASRRFDLGDIKPKDLIGIPWMVAFALRGDGWWLRSDIVWAKPNPMPESVTDRPTRSHEHVFLLTKNSRYFYNQEAAREPLTESSLSRLGQPNYENQAGSDRANGGAKTNGKMKAVAAHFGGRLKSQINDQTRLASGNEWAQDPATGANWRDVWSIATAPFRDAHFAVFPAELAERCIKAGSKAGDTILDPFAGAFTTAMVADRLQRDAIGIELNPEYCTIAERRLHKDAGMFAEVSHG